MGCISNWLASWDFRRLLFFKNRVIFWNSWGLNPTHHRTFDKLKWFLAPLLVTPVKSGKWIIFGVGNSPILWNAHGIPMKWVSEMIPGCLLRSWKHVKIVSYWDVSWSPNSLRFSIWEWNVDPCNHTHLALDGQESCKPTWPASCRALGTASNVISITRQFRWPHTP